ncbi:MAG: metallophosphoesterase [Actinobacteria bacterium]|nr:metallophosphoesterase [Actinomycetota bacterium]
MSLALLYDVHGNLPALEAVLADAEEAGASAFVLGGDYALFGGWPAETLDRLEALPDAELPVARRSAAQRAVHERNVAAVRGA